MLSGPKPPRVISGRNSPSIYRGDWIRTSDRSAPSRVRYQTAPRPESGRPDSNRHRELGRLLCDRYTTPAWSRQSRVVGLPAQQHPLPADVRGHAERGFGRVAESFAKLVSTGRGGGALVVRLRGETMLDLSTGWADRARTRPWKPETLALSFSTTKGIASTVVHRLAERGELDYDERVATYWPEFGVNGKSHVTVRDLLTHRAGLWSV